MPILDHGHNFAPSSGKPHRGVIYSVGPSFRDINTIWIGTDDGLIQVTRDGGKTWQNVTPTELTPWSKVAQLPSSALERMQRTLTRLGLYSDRIDGKAGMLTRAALGAYQKANGLTLDCWPSQAVLDHIQARAN